MGVTLRLSAGRISLYELTLLIDVVEQYIGDMLENKHPTGVDLVALYAVLASAYVEIGRADIARKIFVRSLLHTSYHVAKIDKLHWNEWGSSRVDRIVSVPHNGNSHMKPVISNLLTSLHHKFDTITSPNRFTMDEDREKLVKSRKHANHVHFITIASESNEELKHLLYSAHTVSGINITVIGLDKEYMHYGNKIQWTYESVRDNMKAGAIKNDDIVVFMDAYDVLVFPTIRSIAQTFSRQRADPNAPIPPIVFCSEHGLYPEFSSGWHVPRTYSAMSSSSSVYDYPNTSKSTEEEGLKESEARQYIQSNLLDAKHLNSGCYIGEAYAVRDMLFFLNSQSNFYRDDQQSIVRYALSKPHLIGVDINKVYFRTAYRQFYDFPHVALSIDFNILSLCEEQEECWGNKKKCHPTYNLGDHTSPNDYGGSPTHLFNQLVLLIKQSVNVTTERFCCHFTVRINRFW